MRHHWEGNPLPTAQERIDERESCIRVSGWNMPVWFAGFLFIAFIISCALLFFFSGVAHTEAEQLRAARAAEQQALAKINKPMEWASAESINATVWELTQERDQITNKGTK